MNTLKTILLLGILTSIVVAVGAIFGGRDGMIMAFIFAMVTNIGSYWFSDRLALSMSGAQPVTRAEAPELYDIVESLAGRAQIPVPRVYLIASESPNAFATGRDPEHSAIAVTTGIMRVLNRKELLAVLGHELAHVRNRDVLITTIAAVLASVITMIAHWGMFLGSSRDNEGGVNPIFAILLVVLAPIAASIVNLAISRAREFDADESGARLSGEPIELANALAKIHHVAQQIPMRDVNPALASLYIMKPDPQSWFVNLFSTHPPTEERIRRLQELARNMRARSKAL